MDDLPRKVMWVLNTGPEAQLLRLQWVISPYYFALLYAHHPLR